LLKKLIPKSRYARNVITLMTGTGLAQAIPIAISPILTRLYTPEDFGIFAMFMAIASIASVLVTARYELAIMLPKSDRDAFHIVALSVGLSCLISGLLLLLVVVFNSQITTLLGTPEISNWLYWGPVSTVLMGIYTSLNYWSNRKSNYRRLAISRVVQNASSSLPQLAAGFMKSGPLGLVGGQLAGQLLATSVMASLIYRDDKIYTKKIHLNRLLVLAKKYMNYPKFMIAGQLMNTISGSLPLFLLSTLFSPAIAGFYSLSQRVLIAPSVLIGSAIGDVYLSDASRIYRVNGNCLLIYKKTFLRLCLVSVVFVLPVFLFGNEIFAYIFGENWREAGEIASILAIMVLFQTISSPLSQTVLFANLQKIDLIWQFLRLILAGCTLLAGYYFYGDYKTSLIWFSFSFSFLYLIHLYFQFQVARGMK
jgi:O-antigen/teichoic acid export membrane protein